MPDPVAKLKAQILALNNSCLCVCMEQAAIEWVPVKAGGDGAGVRQLGGIKDSIVLTQQTDGMSACTRSRVTALGCITKYLKSR